jgi:hypothetical protein
MHRFASLPKIALLSALIFANSILILAQPDSIYRLPVGTRIVLKLDVDLSSEVSSVDDTFLATIAKPVKVRDATVLPVGTTVEGRVAAVERASGGGQSGSLSIVFEKLKLPGEIRRIDGFMVTPPVERPSRTVTFLSVIGGIAAGAALGATTRSSNGALIGAALGAAAGTGAALLHKGKDVRIKKDHEFEIELKKEVLLPVADY